MNLTNGQSFHSIKTAISFGEANGTFGFSTASTNKSYKAPTGTFTVVGANLTMKVKFTVDPGTGSPLELMAVFLARWASGR